MNLLAIGTLCLIVEGETAKGDVTGVTCTVIGHRAVEDREHVVELARPFGVYTHAHASRYALQPIAPPGDPDRVVEPLHVPEELPR